MLYSPINSEQRFSTSITSIWAHQLEGSTKRRGIMGFTILYVSPYYAWKSADPESHEPKQIFNSLKKKRIFRGKGSVARDEHAYCTAFVVYVAVVCCISYWIHISPCGVADAVFQACVC